MMTQLDMAKGGRVTSLMRRIARDEGVSADYIRKGVASGRIVMPKNRRRALKRPCGIGGGLRTKVNCNIGTSPDSSKISAELAKMREAVKLGADTIMDLSTGNRMRETMRAILKGAPIPVGTVPIYEIAIAGRRDLGSIKDIPEEKFFAVLEEQAEDGVDFFTIHAGVTTEVLKKLKTHPRILDIVSRGGAFLAQWMLARRRENPFYERFDRVLEIARRHDIVLSLGDGLRPGSIADATDEPQVAELQALGELHRRALASGVQAIIEGPGHVPIDQIEKNVILEKSICNGAPFYVLGPLVTDVAPGYDHITSAIGGAIAASKGADFLCYVTPSEHLRLPTLEDVREGMVASKIAAHAADIAKGIIGAKEMDISISMARKSRDWKRQFALAIDRERPEAYRKSSRPGAYDVCTMCSKYCSIKLAEECLKR